MACISRMEACISRMPWLRSTIAAEACAGLKTREGTRVGSSCDGATTTVEVAVGSVGWTVAAATEAVGCRCSGCVVAAGRGPDIADTRLIGSGGLPRVDRRLQEWEIGGRGLNSEERQRGVVAAPEEGEGS